MRASTGWDGPTCATCSRPARTWNGPIKDFQLTIRKQAASDILSLCFDGDLKKIDPLTFQFKQANFVPMRDLNVLFVRAPE